MSTYDENYARLKKVADENGLVFNPDEARVQKVIGLMSDNYDAVAEYVCPCKQTQKPPVKGKDILCPCPDMLQEIEKDGHCFCQLFYSPDEAKKS